MSQTRLRLLEGIQKKLSELTSQISQLQKSAQSLTETLAQVKASTDQNSVDSEHYKRGVAGCIRILNGATGERLGLDTGLRNFYPFMPK